MGWIVVEWSAGKECNEMFFRAVKSERGPECTGVNWQDVLASSEVKWPESACRQEAQCSVEQCNQGMGRCDAE